MFDILHQTRDTVFHHISDTEKRVENTTRREVFLTNFEVFDIVMKHCDEYLNNFSNKLILKGKLRMQTRGVFHQISKHVTVYDFLCLWLLNYE